MKIFKYTLDKTFALNHYFQAEDFESAYKKVTEYLKKSCVDMPIERKLKLGSLEIFCDIPDGLE